jgi:hypothetical protein
MAAVFDTLPASVVVKPVSVWVWRISLLPQSATSSWHGWYPPAAQRAHAFDELAPDAVENRPGPQNTHLAAPEAVTYVPASQVWQPPEDSRPRMVE